LVTFRAQVNIGHVTENAGAAALVANRTASGLWSGSA
jgi:hypothetical protein